MGPDNAAQDFLSVKDLDDFRLKCGTLVPVGYYNKSEPVFPWNRNTEKIAKGKYTFKDLTSHKVYKFFENQINKFARSRHFKEAVRKYQYDEPMTKLIFTDICAWGLEFTIETEGAVRSGRMSKHRENEKNKIIKARRYLKRAEMILQGLWMGSFRNDRQKQICLSVINETIKNLSFALEKKPGDRVDEDVSRRWLLEALLVKFESTFGLQMPALVLDVASLFFPKCSEKDVTRAKERVANRRELAK